MPNHETGTREFDELLDRMMALSVEIEDLYECTQPAYGVPGHAHCAACCYGTGFLTTCSEDQAMVDAALSMRKAVLAWRTTVHVATMRRLGDA